MGDSANENVLNSNESEIRRRNVNVSTKDPQIGDLINLNDDPHSSARHSISDPSKSGQDTADSDHVSSRTFFFPNPLELLIFFPSNYKLDFVI